MSVTIGRADLNCGPWGGTIYHDNDRLSFNVEISPDTFAEAQVLRQQLLGHSDPAHNVVPVEFDDDTYGWDGYYVVERVSVAPLANYLNNNRMDAEITLRLIGQQVVTEIRTQTKLRANNASITLSGTESPIFCPANAQSFGDEDGNGPTATVTTATGTLDEIPRSNVDGIHNAAADVPTDSWYDGAACVEWSPDSGTTYYPFVGRSLPKQDSISPTPVRISNGLVRLTFDGSGNEMESYDEISSVFAWRQSAADFNVQRGAVSVDTTDPIATAVIRNDPVCVVVRVLRRDNSYVDYSLMRGHRVIECTVGLLTAYSSSGAGLYMNDGTGTGNSFAGIVKRNANDSNGLRWVLLAPYAGTKATTTEPKMTSTTQTCGIGYTTDANISGTCRPLYFAGMSQTQRVIRR